MEEAVNAFDYVFYHRSKRIELGLSATSRFAHYTSAEAAARILQGENGTRQLWLRNASEMNDFSEMEHGQQCLQAALDSSHGDRFREILSRSLGTAYHTAFKFHQAGVTTIKDQTYLTSFAHHDGEQLEHGLLSMWRAYGGIKNVCILFRPFPFLKTRKQYDVTISPVFYGDKDKVTREFSTIVDRFLEKETSIKKLGSSRFIANLIQVFAFAVQSTKHPSFEEENEWRLLYREDPYPEDKLPTSIRSIGDVVQRVYHYPLTPALDANDVSFAADDIIDRIMIGPTSNSRVMIDAFEQLLRDAGVADPRGRVTASGIPLRR